MSTNGLHTGGVTGSIPVAPTISTANLGTQCAPSCSTEHEHAPMSGGKLGEPVHAPSTPSPAPGWRDIESAPKDGKTRVLLGRFTGDPKAMNEGLMAVDWYRTEYSGHGFVGFGLFNNTYWPATHWMPLPPPPTTEEGR